MGKLNVAIMGATGMVGQQYIRLLEKHPWFEISILMGKRSAGKKFGDAVEWVGSYDPPSKVKEVVVSEIEPEKQAADLFFSCLPSEVAREVEGKFAQKYPVVSDTSAYRMESDVPIIIPELNSEHIKIIERQKRERGWKGFIVTGPNCTTTGLAVALKPLDEAYNVRKVFVTTMQAVSGAGYPGVPSLLIIDNVIPYIKDEEEKVARETRKILGKFQNGIIVENDMMVAASCNRVPVIDGHLESVYIETEKKVNVEEAKSILRDFKGVPQELKLPSAPEKPILVREENDRPQPRRDRDSGSVPGMSVVVGRVRKGLDEYSLQFTVLSHNTIRGAAGNAILTAELLYRMEYIK
ncbi:MAG: aspartate-semialdehyde dehydrogenase [Nitrososphaeria archaeon]|nr:aspartate-semialdehyde dehydrogenase [Nitrososphaeria archaeon]